MSVEVKHETVEVVYDGGASGPARGEVYYAVCDECGKRSKGFMVGVMSAPLVEAELEARDHACDLADHFSFRAKAWARFWDTLAGDYKPVRNPPISGSARSGDRQK